MLVLSRRKGETVRIGDDITVNVYRIMPGQVRLAFEAPREVPILREEVYLKISQEKLAMRRGEDFPCDPDVSRILDEEAKNTGEEGT